VLLIAGLESSLGTDFGLSQQRGFFASADYMVHVTGPTGLVHNYSDCGRREGPLAAMYWFASQRKDPSLLFFEEPSLAGLIGSGASKLEDIRLFPFLLLWANPSLKASEPKTLDWSSSGPTPVAFLRSSWKSEALFVGIKGGSPSTSHAHMDIGSFVFDAQGVRWAVDLGMQDYNSLESRGIKLWGMNQNSDRWKVFRLSNASHSVLVINDQPQTVSGRAEVVSHGLETANPEAALDCSSLFSGQAQKVVRTFSFPERRELVIDDAVQSVAANGTVRWQMVTEADIAFSGADALLREKGKTVRVHRINPDQGEWSVLSISKPRNDFDAANPGAKLLLFNVPVHAGDSLRVTVKLTPEQ
jgi:hypothetical protein